MRKHFSFVAKIKTRLPDNWLAFLGKYWKIVVPVAVILIIFVPVLVFAFISEEKKSTSRPIETQAAAESEEQDEPSADEEGEEAVAAPAPVPKPAVTPTPPPITPSSVLKLTNWKLTLPVNTSHEGDPDEISQPELATYSSEYFQLTAAKNGVIFRAHAGGATTSNSGYPRSELREMTNGGKTKASWSNANGTHTLTIRQAITHVPVVKPEVVAAQIHDASDDVIMIRLEGAHLFVESGGENVGTLNAAYALGEPYTVKIDASGGRVKVAYNGELKVDIPKSGSGWYFKAGCYTQSNPKRGEDPNAYGEVIIYSLAVTH